jgi:hypothetical protein
LAEIATNQNIETVLMAARWPAYVEGSWEAPWANKTFTLSNTHKQSSIWLSEDNSLVVREVLKNVVKRISSSGKRVILIGSAPEIHWNVGAAITAQTLFGRDLPQPPLMENVRKRQAKTNSILSELSKGSSVTFINLTERMCGKTCPTHDGATAYYTDNNHLTPQGVKLFAAPILAATLQDAPAVKLVPIYAKN